MLPIPITVLNQYIELLRKKEIPFDNHADYIKWLRYFLDFRSKHQDSYTRADHVKLFLEKLRQKKQSEAQCRQAAHAVSLYFDMQLQDTPIVESDMPGESNDSIASTSKLEKYVTPQRISQYSLAGYEEKSDSPEWDVVLAALAGEIKVRHYSRKTLKTYALWSRQFQRYLKNKSPQELTTDDVKHVSDVSGGKMQCRGLDPEPGVSYRMKAED